MQKNRIEQNGALRRAKAANARHLKTQQSLRQQLKWAHDSRSRWIAATEALEDKLNKYSAALEAIASRPCRKDNFNGMKGAAAMQKIAMDVLGWKEKI